MPFGGLARVESSELAAREAIRDTIARYAHYADGGRFDELVDLFTEDGALEVAGEAAYRGRAAIRSFVAGVGDELAASTEVPHLRHYVTSVLIDLESADRARAACYFLAVTATGVDHWGRYRDLLVRDGDRWLFAHRVVRTDGFDPASWVARRLRTDSPRTEGS